ncbi:MAG: helix-turn-helix domain-containing protein [Bacteroidetes bacterium]|nr:helix-turn-helix domain-containing protein [Bacteroidota bacterium]
MKGIGYKFTLLLTAILLCGCIGLPSPGYANKQLCGNIELAKFEVLQDTSGTLAIADVLHASGYKPSNELAFGYTQYAYWIRTDVPELCSPNETYFAYSEYSGLDYIDFYVVRGDSLLKGLETGYLRSVATRERHMNKMIMELPMGLQPGDQLYVRLQKKEGTLRTVLRILDEETLRGKTLSTELHLFFFLGVCFLMILFATAYLLSFRKPLFGWYILFVFSFACHQAINQGYGPLYIWGDWFWMSNVGRVAFNAPTILATLCFSYHILRVKDFSPSWVNSAYKYLIAYKIFEIPLPFLPLPEYPWRFVLYTIHIAVLVATLVVLITAAVNAIKRRHVPGYLFIAGEGVLFFTVLIMALRNFNIVPQDALPEYIDLYVGVTTMSLALFSMVAHTRQMYTKVVTQFVEAPKPEPKQLTDEEVQKAGEALQQIEQYFKTHKPYLDPELSVKKLVDLTDIPEHIISRAINHKADMHFFDYVNQYRVAEAKQLLTDETAVKQFTIEALAMQCGFNNKTSFNKAFKKFTGETPSAYRDRLAQTRDIS